MSHWPKQLFVFLLSAVILISVCLLFVWYRALHRPMLTRGTETSVKVYPGSTIHDLADRLAQRGLMTHPRFLVFDARISGDSKKIRFGEYRITPGMSVAQLLDNVVTGKGLVMHRITFLEGWTFRDIKKLLNENEQIRHQVTDKTNAQIMELLGHPKEHPEGRFFPDTYQYTWGNTDLDILAHAYDRMQTFLSEQWERRVPGLPYNNAYEALIVASLIEKETSLDKERPIIANVILNRLKNRMRLQIDPTVLYGVKKSYDTVITKKYLRAKNPYNTYQIYGLPPTPIDMPSGASIIAALHPANTKYLYYVSRGDGSHVFSTTYREHLKAVRQYRIIQKDRSKEQVTQRALPQLTFAKGDEAMGFPKRNAQAPLRLPSTRVSRVGESISGSNLGRLWLRCWIMNYILDAA